MNTKLLKQKILDLAIRGKLSQQFKSDGTAADLLKEICDRTQEKTSLRAKRGNPSPQTIIPLDKNEAPFEVPANWEWVRIGDIFNLQAGKNIAAGLISSTCEDGYYPCFGGNGLRGFVSCFNREGDYPLIGRQGALCGNINRATGKFYATEHAVVVETNSMMNVSLACFFLTQLNLNQYASSTAQPGLSVAKINEVPIPLPPLAEQQRIVAKIEEAFAEIDAIEKNKDLLKTHIKQTRQKILDLAIHGKLVPQNKSDEPASILLERITRDNPHYEKLTDIPFEIPESWEWVNAEDLFNIRSAIRIHQTDWQKEGIPFFRGRELVQLCKTGNVDFEIYISEKLYEENKRKGGVPQKNDILVSAVGTLGFAYVVKGNKPFYYKDAYILCFENRHNLNPFYFQHLIHSKFINKIIYGGSKGTTVDQLTIENAKKLPMPLPPLAEQKRIVNKIEEIFASLDEISLHLV
ncbi:MAG: restriction endonuclease subunit S [Fibrobacter sp.]|uniref:restriction endonuclease subunit S n=1 Tax=Fibrobacter sp. TaxID=35828 RepID=UPI001B15CD83|nr:restriction endonuclease subunit S [Fibrobacter sp.]MBO7059768.1 restriction endonuclease subunit S [Fibrobacter sp.]